MIDWDDVRYFLAAARGGSVRAVAGRLGVNHATVLRRIAQLEERLGAQMFEKLPSGYRLTAAGEEVLELAIQMEASSQELETRVFGRDQSVRGLLRVTLAPTLATHLLMPDRRPSDTSIAPYKCKTSHPRCPACDTAQARTIPPDAPSGCR